jgi:hypothetical protein
MVCTSRSRCELSYIIQLGNKAIGLVIGDLVGEKNRFLGESFRRLEQLVIKLWNKQGGA